MALGTTNTNLTQIAVKRLSGKAMTNSNLSIPEEGFGSTVQTAALTVFGESLPNNPDNSASDLFLIQSSSNSTPGTVMLVDFELEAINDSQYQNVVASGETDTAVYTADQGQTNVNTFHAYVLKLTGSFAEGVVAQGATYFADNASTPVVLGNAPFTSSFTTTGSVQLQIVPEFVSTITGTSNPYIPKISKKESINTFDGASALSANSGTSGIDYYLDTYSGILFVQDPVDFATGTGNVPGKVRAFVYVGKYQTDVISGDVVSLNVGDGAVDFSIANNASASFETGSGDGLTISSSNDGTDSTLTFELNNVISGSSQITDLGLGLHISASDGNGFDVDLNNTASFVSGTAGISITAGATNKITIGAASDIVTFKDLTITRTASINYLETVFTTSSVIFQSGSTRFGNSLDDTMKITGSLHLVTSASGISGSNPATFGTFKWDGATGNTSTVPLVYDTSTKQIHTGSAYALSADGMTSFNVDGNSSNAPAVITNGNTLNLITGSGAGLSISASNNNDSVTFTLESVVSGAAQIEEFGFIGTSSISSSIVNNMNDLVGVAVSASINTIITSSIINNFDTVFGTEISGAIDAATASLASDIEAGIYFSSSVGGGTSIGLTNTASFIGGDGITVSQSSETDGATITITSDYGELDSPIFLGTGSAGSGTGTSVGYTETASFTSSGAGLSVDVSASAGQGGTIIYTITPDDVLTGATDTSTFNFTASVAASSTSASLAANVTVVDNENTNAARAVIFANPDVGGVQLQSDASGFTYNPGVNEGTIKLGSSGQFSLSKLSLSTSEASSTFNLINTNATTINFGGAATNINMGASTGVVNIAGSASIAGDLIVKGTTTQLNTTNLLVEDRYILLGSGSSDNSVGGGIIVQQGATNSGAALHWDDANSVWAVEVSGKDASSNDIGNATFPIVTVSSSAQAPDIAAGTPAMGGSAAYRYGQMYVDTSDATNGGLYVYLP